MNWLSRHATAIQSLSALITMLVALAALVGVKLQIDAAAEVQAAQSARDIYRGFLELSIAQPQYAHPEACTDPDITDTPGYDAYLDYLLYTTEQVIDQDDGWGPVMEHWLVRHTARLCTIEDLGFVTPELKSLVNNLKSNHCSSAPSCG